MALPVIQAVVAAPRMPAPPVPAPQPPGWWWVRAVVTGYSPYDAIDAAYHRAHPSTKTAAQVDWRENPYGIAVDKRIIPYGTSISVPGYMEHSFPNTAWEADDTGSGVRRSWSRGLIHLDVRFKTEYSAKRFGRRIMDVLVEVEGLTDAQKQRLLPYKTGEL